MAVTVLPPKRESPLAGVGEAFSRGFQQSFDRSQVAKLQLDNQKAMLKFQNDLQRTKDTSVQDRQDDYYQSRDELKDARIKGKVHLFEKLQADVQQKKIGIERAGYDPDRRVAMTVDKSFALDKQEEDLKDAKAKGIFHDPSNLADTSETASDKYSLSGDALKKMKPSEKTELQKITKQRQNIKAYAQKASRLVGNDREFGQKYGKLSDLNRTTLGNYEAASVDPVDKIKHYYTEGFARDVGIDSAAKISGVKNLHAQISNDIRDVAVQRMMNKNLPLTNSVADINEEIYNTLLTEGKAVLDTQLDPGKLKEGKFQQDILRKVSKKLGLVDEPKPLSNQVKATATGILKDPANVAHYQIGATDEGLIELGRTAFITDFKNYTAVTTEQATEIYDAYIATIKPPPKEDSTFDTAVEFVKNLF